MKYLATIALLVSASFSHALAAPPKISSSQAILMDAHTGTVLFEKDADTPAPPGSLSKLLTAYRVFEKLDKGQITLSRRLVLNEKAFAAANKMTRQGAGTMSLEQGEAAKVDDLLRGLIVLSGNDAAIALAEGIDGTEANFSRELNQLAHRLGMENTTIMNATGWSHPAQLMSVRDIAKVSRRLILDFPQYYHYFGQREFLFKPDKEDNGDNLNKLLWIMPGADGLHVGSTVRSGHGIASSITRGNRRLIAVTSGLKTPNANFERYLDARTLLEYGLREFSNFVFYDAGQEIIRVPVWYGSNSRIALGSTRHVMVTAPTGSNPSAEMTVTYLSPAIAPIKRGDKLGTAVLFVDGQEVQSYDLVALRNMRRAMLLGRTWENVKQLILKMWR